MGLLWSAADLRAQDEEISGKTVGKNWSRKFDKRHPQICARMTSALLRCPSVSLIRVTKKKDIMAQIEEKFVSEPDLKKNVGYLDLLENSRTHCHHPHSQISAANVKLDSHNESEGGEGDVEPVNFSIPATQPTSYHPQIPYLQCIIIPQIITLMLNTVTNVNITQV